MSLLHDCRAASICFRIAAPKSGSLTAARAKACVVLLLPNPCQGLSRKANRPPSLAEWTADGKARARVRSCSSVSAPLHVQPIAWITLAAFRYKPNYLTNKAWIALFPALLYYWWTICFILRLWDLRVSSRYFCATKERNTHIYIYIDYHRLSLTTTIVFLRRNYSRTTRP